jgi:hypothetical protein
MMASVPSAAQTITVAVQQRLELQIAGATAAYSLNNFYADASVDNGVVVIQGNSPGTTTIVVVTAIGLQTFRVSIPQPTPVYPPGFVPPRGRDFQEGGYEVRFNNDPSQLQNIVDLSSHQGDRVMRFHMAEANYFNGAATSGSPITLPGLSYELDTPTRDVVLADQTVANSPLTLDSVLVRGFHLREGSWFFHVGYTALSTFQNVLLPTQQDTVVGLGYRIQLGENNSLTPNIYYIDTGTSNATTSHSGMIGSLVFRREVKNRLKLLAEAGYGGGLGVATRLDFQRNKTERVSGDFRYEPSSFSSVSVNNLHGLLSNFLWERRFRQKLSSAVNFSGNRYDLSPSTQQVNISSNWNLNYQLAKHWSAISGVMYSRFSGGIGNYDYLQNVQIPIGLNYSAGHWGAGFVYQAPVDSNQGGSAQGIRTNANFTARPWSISAFWDRQTNVPTVSDLVSSVPGLQDLLNRLGITATTPQQVASLLQNDATLQALGLASNLSLNLSPVLTQAGATLSWSGRRSLQDLFFSVMYSSNQMLNSTQQSTIYSVTYSRRLTTSNIVFASFSLYGTQSPGTASDYRPLFEVSLRHKFNSVPPFFMPGRKGTISGTVFQDLQLEGVFHEGMPPMAGVEVVLDGSRRSSTDAAGHYSFGRVPYGPHRLQATFRTERPFYFTTQSDVTTEIDTAVNFGITFSRARLIGHVLNDASTPVYGVKVGVFGAERIYSAETDAAGNFTIADLAAGTFRAEINSESLPIGYVTEGLEPIEGELPVGLPKHITFRLQAIRAIAGKVSIFDSQEGRDVPMPGVTVRVVETGAECVTDGQGNYLFRQMPAGTFTLAISYQGKEHKLSVSLPGTPAFSRGNDLGLGRR